MKLTGWIFCSMIPIKFRSNEICEEEARMVMKKTAKAASLILVGAKMCIRDRGSVFCYRVHLHRLAYMPDDASHDFKIVWKRQRPVYTVCRKMYADLSGRSLLFRFPDRIH